LDKLDWEAKKESEKILYLIVKQEWNECVKLGKPAVEPLIAALKDKDRYVRKKTVEALGKLGDDRAVASLIVALKDKDRYVRVAAVEALGNLGKPAIESLIASLTDENSRIRKGAAEVLNELDWEAKNESEKILYLIAKQEWNKCVKLGGPAVKPLIAALKDKDRDVRKKAAEALGKLGDGRAVESLIAALKDKNGHIRAAAAEALGRIGGNSAVKPLIAALKDKYSYVRAGAAKALENITGQNFGQYPRKWQQWWDENAAR